MRTSFQSDPLTKTVLYSGMTVPRPEPARVPVPHALTLTSFGQSDIGRQRKTNEDRFLIASPVSALWLRSEHKHAADIGYTDIEGDVFAVADGVGGHAGGGVASTLAIETMGTFLLSTLKWVFALGGPEAIGADMLEQIRFVFRCAEARLREQAARSPSLAEMGTTLTMAYRHGSFLHVGHVGDSRCSLLRDGKLHQITRDHTVVAQLVRDGIVEPNHAHQHVARNLITNAVGPLTDGLQVDVHRVRLHAGDVVLLATDGVTTGCPEADNRAEISSILGRSPTPAKACERLLERANDLGGRDNATAIVVHVANAAAAPLAPRARRTSYA